MNEKAGCTFLTVLMIVSNMMTAYADVSNMTDAEYDLAVAEIMRDYHQDPDAARNALADIGAILLQEPTYEQHYVASNANARMNNPTDYTLSVYSYQRGTESIHRLQWWISCEVQESSPASLDYISIEWDTAYATYVTSLGDGTFSTVQDRGTGIVLFNVEDINMEAGNASVGTVHVNPISAGAMDFGTKIIHTYAVDAVTTTSSYAFASSGSVGIDEASLGLNYTQTYTVTTAPGEGKWQMWADNRVTFS